MIYQKIFILSVYINLLALIYVKSVPVNNIPMTLLKTGARFREPISNEEIFQDSKKEPMSIDETSEDYFSEEEGCEFGFYFHIRGNQCVPQRCDFGYKRNWKTGKCILAQKKNIDFDDEILFSLNPQQGFRVRNQNFQMPRGLHLPKTQYHRVIYHSNPGKINNQKFRGRGK